MKYDWHFPDGEYSEEEGLNDLLLTYFNGNENKFIAREVVQNSIDARKDLTNPVIVKFEKFFTDTKNIPGLQELTDRMNACLQRAKEEDDVEGATYFTNGLTSLNKRQMPILRASDYNTSGLTGDEKSGKWHRLVWAVGVNKMSGPGGGSYGIGKGAPFLGSDFRTVFYSTLNEEGEYLFQGKARLVSHIFKSKKYRAVGFCGQNGYMPVRKVADIQPLFLRKETGTDVNIIGYSAGGSEWMSELASSVLENFWMAIHKGILEVEIIEGKDIIRLDFNTLHLMLKEYSPNEGYIYYSAVQEGDDSVHSFSAELDILGECRLYIRCSEGYPKDIAYMRKPMMIVNKKAFQKLLRRPYAGVFICTNDRGNEILRKLEPPQHNTWDRDLPNGKEVWKVLENWMKECLRKLAEDDGSDPEELPGLENVLPFDDESAHIADSRAGRTEPSGRSGLEETGLEVSPDRGEDEYITDEYIPPPFSSRKTQGDEATDIDTPQGVLSVHKKRKGGKGTDAGSKITRLNTSSITSRTFQTSSGEYGTVIRSSDEQNGAINIVGVGDDSLIYPMALTYAKSWDGKKDYPIEGSLIKDVEVKEGEKIQIRFGLESKARCILGIEEYES